MALNRGVLGGFKPPRTRSVRNQGFRSKKVRAKDMITPPSFTFSEIERGCLGASRLGMVFFRYNPSIFERERKRPLGNAEVPVRSTEKTKFSEPIFFLSPLAKGTAIFLAPKAI